MNFYKHYMGDYARKTAHLSLTDHGVYRILLDHYYSTLAPLPAELLTLNRICRATTELETESVIRVVNEFFPINGDGRRHNTRCDQELATWKKQAETNRIVGKLGGRPPKEHKTDSITEPKPSPEVRSQKLEVRSQMLVEPASLEVIEYIPTVGATPFGVRADFVAELEKAYPAVDVPQTLREIRAWCISNPSRRKTEKGVKRFINSWLAREQNGA